MKAKRIISLLLTVAMIAACGVTAFAAPTGTTGYTTTATTQILSSELVLAEGNVRPDTNEIQAGITVTSMTDDEFYDAFEGTPQEYGAPEGWVDSARLITVSAMKLGTLAVTRTGKGTTISPYKYTGLRVYAGGINIHLGENVVWVAPISSDMGIDETACAFMEDDNYYKFEFSVGADAAYPTDPGTYEDAEISDFITVLVFAGEGSEITFSNAYVMYNHYNANKVNDANGAAWSNTTVALWHPATVTLVEAEGGDDPVVNPEVGAVTGGTTGVDFEDGSDSYDNAFEVSASFSKADAITAAGVLFIPAAYYDGEELNALTENVAIAEYVGNAAGEGTLTIRAAIKGIPRGLVGKTDTVDMRVMPYLRVGDAYTYGDEATKTIDVTEIAPEA